MGYMTEYLVKKDQLTVQNKIFDICDTLYRSNTTMDFCEYRAIGFQKMFLKFSKTFLGKVINKFLINLFNYDWIRSIHIKTLKNIARTTIESDADSFVDNYLNNKKIEEVHKYLETFNKNEVILVSATIDPVAKAISKSLGNINYLSTTLNYKDSICLGIIKEDLLGNKQKYFESKNIDFIITDNKSDLKLCKLSKKIIIVSKKKNIEFWKKQNLEISKIIEVD